ncbi:hypothetical protein Q73_02090 [Bacillus coahuilensis m2-6]|nr:hypothetical protein Q73_02090 [Bacillus coahuilensis m2-6]
MKVEKFINKYHKKHGLQYLYPCLTDSIYFLLFSLLWRAGLLHWHVPELLNLLGQLALSNTLHQCHLTLIASVFEEDCFYFFAHMIEPPKNKSRNHLVSTFIFLTDRRNMYAL